MCPETPEEDLIAWLERCEIPIEDQTNIDSFRTYLKDELGITKDTQVEALWSAAKGEDTLAEHGIHAVKITYPWGVEIRYGVQGMAGLWGWAAVSEIMEEETT